MSALDTVVQGVLGSKRYRGVDPKLVHRLATDALRKHPGDATAARKSTQRQLHQLFGAYMPGRPRWSKLLAHIETAGTDPVARREACVRAMSTHASTQERLAGIDEHVALLAQVVRPTDRVLDLACGMGPLSWAFTDARPASLHCVDIGVEIIEFLGKALPMLDVNATAAVGDLGAPTELPDADLAILLKALPCLAHTLSVNEMTLLKGIPAKRFLVSWPTRSLSNKAKDMEDTYRARTLDIAERLGWTVEEHMTPGELCFVLERPEAPPSAP